MQGRALNIAEVEGREIIIHFKEKEKRDQTPEAKIQELVQIINQKNATIEQQAEYIAELQQQNSEMRLALQMADM